jgi:hypothetical protein
MPEEKGPENKLLEQAMQQIGGCIDSMTVTNIDRLHVAVCGESGTGKSNLIARTARKPIYVCEFDNRKESIAEIPGVIIKQYLDKSDDNPVAWANLESDISTFEYLKTKNEFPFKSIALDSMTFLHQITEHQFLKTCPATMAKWKIGNTTYLVGRDWDAVVGVQKMLDGLVNRLFALDIDVYVTFHTRNEKDKVKSTAKVAVYTEKLDVNPPNIKVLLPKFNDKWRTFVDDGKYMVQLRPDFQFNAATVLKNVGETEIADIQKMLEKHKNGVK